MLTDSSHFPKENILSEEELAHEWIGLPEVFVTPYNYRLFLNQLFGGLYLLIQDLSPDEVSRMINEVNRIYRFYDISELVSDRLLVYSDADLNNIFGERRMTEIKPYDRDIYQFMNQIMQYLINITLENRLYLSQFPDINYRFHPKSRNCYSISSYYFNHLDCTIVMYKQNPWIYEDERTVK